MTIKLGVVMDPISTINVKKDSTFAMLLEAQARGWEVWYMEQPDLSLLDGTPVARMQRLDHIVDDPTVWFTLGEEVEAPLDGLDAILMRKDPPFDMEYIYSTYILERTEKTLVVNRPQALRDANEKAFTAAFSQCTPPTLISCRASKIKAFHDEHEEIILKPLDGMGGAGVFRVGPSDPNINVVIETLTEHGSQLAMAQRYVPEIQQGDKRILLVDGEAVPYCLARVPPEGETRGNLAVGATGEGRELSDRDRWICAEVGPRIKEMGLIFVGLDVIGDYLTEINVTSPTCIRELDAIYSLNIAGQLLDAVEARLLGLPPSLG